MKKKLNKPSSVLAFFLLFFMFSFYANAQQLIGALTVISDKPIFSGFSGSSIRNVEVDTHGVKIESNSNESGLFQNYELLKKKEGLSPAVLESNSGITIQDAVNKVVTSCRCGEVLMNAEIYSYEGSYVVVGDVYGKKLFSCMYQIGDIVSWGKRNMGEIVAIIDEDECVVKDFRTNRQKEIDFDELFFAKTVDAKFQVGDKVSWKGLGGKYMTGVIVSARHEYGCIVKELETGKQKEMLYEDLYLINE